jgi:hypothetical protein
MSKRQPLTLERPTPRTSISADARDRDAVGQKAETNDRPRGGRWTVKESRAERISRGVVRAHGFLLYPFRLAVQAASDLTQATHEHYAMKINNPLLTGLKPTKFVLNRKNF